MVFALLFLLLLTVWIPCAFSDLVFPLLWVGKEHVHEHDREHWDASQHQ